MAQSLSNLAVGAKVKFGKYSVDGETAQDLVWIIVAKSHSCTPAYPTNSITLLTEKIIDLRCFDAEEPNNSNSGRKSYGNNRYSLSNLDQWLNKDAAASTWYSAAHSADQSPNTSEYCGGYNTQYSARPGFLNAFSAEEKNAIQSTTIRVVKPSIDGGSYEDISRKIFLPSVTEVGFDNETYAEGKLWAYFNNNARCCALTTQCYNNTQSSSKPSSVTSNWYWFLRTPNRDDAYRVAAVDTHDNYNTIVFVNNGFRGVRPALNLLSSLSVSDTTDSDGCYTVVWNRAPSAPTTLNVPTTVYGGKSNTISWSSVVDPDGDKVTYVLECAYNGGGFSQLYSGTARTYNHFVTSGKTSIRYRVKAIDSKGASSAYTTSTSKTIVNNKAPVISDSDRNLGILTDEYTVTYVVTDADSDTVTVVERIDNVQLRSYVVTLGVPNDFELTGETWLKQSNGTHTITITATDTFGNSTVRTYTFTKNVTSFTIRNTTPLESDTMPTRITLTVNRDIPTEADFLVEVCNNGYDSSPTWEDCTSSVTGGLVHVFENIKKTANKWGVVIKVTVNRNGGEGACYVNSIGGNFE